MESKNLERGIQLFELARYKDAIKYFNNVMSEDPDDSRALYYITLCNFNEEEYDKAENIANNLIKREPNNPDILYLISKIAFHKNDDKKALVYIDNAITINPYDSDYFGLKSAIFLHKKKFDEALEYANEALKINPKNSYCLNLRAKILTKLDRTDEANQTVENILNDNPEDSFSHANIGWVELENGNNKKALEHFKEALQYSPNFEYAREGMSTALKSKNILYKWYLKYAFWMENKSTKNQWIFIIGIYFAYRFSVKILSTANMAYLAIPLMITYLLFALGGWLMEPMSNSILMFDKYGKYLLGKEQKLSGYTFGILLFAGIISIALFYTMHLDYFLCLAITFFCTLLPLPRAFLLDHKKGKFFGVFYGSTILLIGIFGILFIPNYFTIEIIVFIMMMAFTWIGNLFN